MEYMVWICLDWKDFTCFRNAALLEENETPEFIIMSVRNLERVVDVTWARGIQGLCPPLIGSFLGVYQHVWSYEQSAMLLGPSLSKEKIWGLEPRHFSYFYCLGIFLLFLNF